MLHFMFGYLRGLPVIGTLEQRSLSCETVCNIVHVGQLGDHVLHVRTTKRENANLGLRIGVYTKAASAPTIILLTQPLSK